MFDGIGIHDMILLYLCPPPHVSHLKDSAVQRELSEDEDESFAGSSPPSSQAAALPSIVPTSLGFTAELERYTAPGTNIASVPGFLGPIHPTFPLQAR